MPEEEAKGGLIHVVIRAEPLFEIAGFQVTNSMVGAVLASLILLAGITAGSTSRWRSYVGLVIGLFLMILVANWLGLLPGVGTVGVPHEEHGEEVLVPFVRPAAADLNFTLGLAIITFVTFVWWAIRLHGPIGYLKELVGEPRYMAPLMFPIHLISELSRLVSLSMRLFGNVFAGEVLLATILALTALVLPLALFVPAVFLWLELIF